MALWLSKSLIGSPVAQGTTATWRLTVENNPFSTGDGTGIVARDIIPASFTFVSAKGGGTFNPANGQWAVPDLAPGNSASITITGTISSSGGSMVSSIVEIIEKNEFAPDSTVNNGATTEDDFAISSFTLQAGRPPGCRQSSPSIRQCDNWA